MSKITRRAAIAAAVSLPLVPVQAAVHPVSFPLTHGCDLELIELRRAIDAYQAAVHFEMSIEGKPGHAEAVAESEALEAVVSCLVEAIHERTPASVRDIALRAEALRQWFFGGHRECLDAWTGRDHFAAEYCFAKLYEAAVIVTGGEHA